MQASSSLAKPYLLQWRCVTLMQYHHLLLDVGGEVAVNRKSNVPVRDE